MANLARRENISIERLGGVMTADAASWAAKSGAVMRAAGQAGAELVDEKILDSYRRTLAAVSEQGIERVVGDHMRPFLKAARSHLQPGCRTWIERKLGLSATDEEK